jgi:hypothetical protein
LRHLGWHYVRVHSFELFANPDGIADRVQNILVPVVVERVDEVVTAPLDLPTASDDES